MESRCFRSQPLLPATQPAAPALKTPEEAECLGILGWGEERGLSPRCSPHSTLSD